MPTFNQGKFDFDTPGSDTGWRKWREQLDERKRAFEARWGVVLGKIVEVRLRDLAKPLRGRLEWIADNGKTGQGNPHSQPRFRLQGLEFGHEEIESVVQMEA